MQEKLRFVIVIAATAMWCGAAGAQMVVHAVAGIVKAVNNAQTMDVAVDEGSTSQFQLSEKKKVALDFDNDLRADSVDANKFQHVGDYVVVYYYGFDDDKTAVAVKDLGAGPFEKAEGTVVSFDKRDHMLKITDDGGKPLTFALSDHLVVDSGLRVDSGRGYDPHKGYQVRVTYTTSGAKNTAVFIRSRQQ